MSLSEITTGLSVSLSGNFQLQGQQALQGLLFWRSYANAQGGIANQHGKRRAVRLIWYDDHSQISCACKNVQRLLKEDHVDILLGPYSSSLTMAVAEIAEENKKLLWNHGGSSDDIYKHGWRYVIGVASPASEYLRTLPRWLAREVPGFSRICVLYSGRGTFAWQVARGILESALPVARHSVHLVPVNIPWENHDPIFGVLSGIAPEVVVLVGSFQDEFSLMQTRRCWPRTVSAVAAVAAGVRAFADLGEIADGVLGPSQWEPGTTFPDIVGPTSDWFLDRFQSQFNLPPDYIAAASFATGVILTECIRRTTYLDDEELRNTACDLDCNTFYGRFCIDSRSGKQMGHRVLLVRWKSGHRVVLTP
jgi:branched-chain amino acid transport system substrate-binding protein